MEVDDKKNNIYKWVKIGGILSFIPAVLAAGPIAGYVLGSYLEKRFGAPFYISIICLTIGLVGSVFETVKIVKFAIRTEEERK